MEGASEKLVPRKRCSSNAELDCASAKLARGEKSDRQVVSRRRAIDLLPGADVWLTGLTDLPSLNGEQCRFESYDVATRCARVRRACSNETMLVRRANLTKRAPNGIEACMTVLARALSREVAEKIMAFATCQRCWQACTPGSVCQVVHPASQRQVLSSHNAHADETYLACFCNACHSKYQDFYERHGVRTGAGQRMPLNVGEFEKEGLRSLSRRERPFDASKFDPSKMYDEFEYRFCFEGEHTVCAPRKTDFRRAVPHDAELYAHCNPNLQDELDLLPDYISSLRVFQYPGGPQEPFSAARCSACAPSLKRALPNLTHFETDLESFEVSGQSEDGEILLPNLKSLKIHNRNLNSMKDMLQSATASLEVVELRNVKKKCKTLIFASIALRKMSLVDIALKELTLYAPDLRQLTIEGCSRLEIIVLLKDYKKSKSNLPSGFSPPPLTIDLRLQDKEQSVRFFPRGRPNVTLNRWIRHGGEWKNTKDVVDVVAIE